MHLKLILSGSKLPTDLSMVRLTHSQAKPARSSLRDTRRPARPFPAERVFLLFARFLTCVSENDFITITRRRRSIHP
jgi:hypothetical protein